MNVTDILVQAARAVDEAEIENDLRAVAFGKAVDIIARRAEPEPMQTPSVADRLSKEPANIGAGDSPIGNLAAKLKLDVDTLKSVYDCDGDTLNLVLSPTRLDRKSASGTKQIALLVAAGRQGAGLDEEWTPVEEIRRVAEDFKRLDSANFASTIKEMVDEFQFRGTPRKREVRVSRPGWESATALVNRLANGG